MDADRKRILAQTAASLIQRGQFLFLDSGSTNLALANILPADFELTVVTNSVDIAAAMLRRTDLQLVMTGGLVDQHVGGSVDPTSVEFVRRMSFDLCFIGACAVSTSRGIGAFGERRCVQTRGRRCKRAEGRARHDRETSCARAL